MEAASPISASVSLVGDIVGSYMYSHHDVLPSPQAKQMGLPGLGLEPPKA
jgi:hypothetical protein